MNGGIKIIWRQSEDEKRRKSEEQAGKGRCVIVARAENPYQFK